MRSRTRWLSTIVILILTLGYLVSLCGRAEAVALTGIAGPGISGCAISGDGVLSSKRTIPTTRGVRYIFQGRNGKWTGEQWEIGRWDQPPGSRLLASSESIERTDVQSMRCTYLSTKYFQPCGPGLEVDEGPDVALESILITPTAISVRIVAFYNNFFSRGNYKLRDQLYFVQLDNHTPIEPIVTGAKSQDFTFRLSGAESGRHSITYGIISTDYSTPPRVQKLGNCVNLNIPNAGDQDK
jgi:hypothetical protein